MSRAKLHQLQNFCAILIGEGSPRKRNVLCYVLVAKSISLVFSILNQELVPIIFDISLIPEARNQMVKLIKANYFYTILIFLYKTSKIKFFTSLSLIFVELRTII